jgi:hypothetical protein
MESLMSQHVKHQSTIEEDIKNCNLREERRNSLQEMSPIARITHVWAVRVHYFAGELTGDEIRRVNRLKIKGKSRVYNNNNGV